MKKILYYPVSADKTEKLECLCKSLGMAFRKIEHSETGKELAVILSDGMKKENSGRHDLVPPVYMMPEVMIMQGFESDDIDFFLSETRKAGIERAKYLAVVTPYNIGWTVYELVRELSAEQKYINDTVK